jgi:hypothetical protein
MLDRVVHSALSHRRSVMAACRLDARASQESGYGGSGLPAENVRPFQSIRRPISGLSAREAAKIQLVSGPIQNVEDR